MSKLNLLITIKMHLISPRHDAISRKLSLVSAEFKPAEPDFGQILSNGRDKHKDNPRLADHYNSRVLQLFRALRFYDPCIMAKSDVFLKTSVCGIYLRGQFHEIHEIVYDKCVIRAYCPASYDGEFHMLNIIFVDNYNFDEIAKFMIKALCDCEFDGSALITWKSDILDSTDPDFIEKPIETAEYVDVSGEFARLVGQ